MMKMKCLFIEVTKHYFADCPLSILLQKFAYFHSCLYMQDMIIQFHHTWI